MRPLSPFKFFMRNKKRVSIIVVILMCSVSVVAFITSIVNNIIITAKDGNLRPFEYGSAVASIPGEFFIRDEILEKINSYEATDKVINVIIEDTMFAAIMGNTNIPLYFVGTEENIAELLNVFDTKLTAGRLPQENEYEVVLHEKILKNKSLKVGDFIGSDVNENEFLSGKYLIVGSINGNAITGFGSRSSIADAYESAGLSLDKPQAVLVVPKKNQLDNLNKELDKLSNKEASVYTHSSLKRQLDAQIGSINAILNIIIFVTVFVLAISVGSLVYIIYLGRSDEFGILYAMGYKRGFIYKRIVGELAFLNIFCWILGFIMSLVMIHMLNLSLLDNKGQTMPLMTLQATLNTLIIPIMVLTCAAFPILYKLNKWDPIAIIERRD